tara:strand:- start:568 stop:684 length:117 start_codon:yes stop_codon:yes gene_type:complete
MKAKDLIWMLQQLPNEEIEIERVGADGIIWYKEILPRP